MHITGLSGLTEAREAADGTFVKPQLRDLLFAAIEQHLSPALFEVWSDWPTGSVDWAEVVVLGLR